MLLDDAWSQKGHSASITGGITEGHMHSVILSCRPCPSVGIYQWVFSSIDAKNIYTLWMLQVLNIYVLVIKLMYIQVSVRQLVPSELHRCVTMYKENSTNGSNWCTQVIQVSGRQLVSYGGNVTCTYMYTCPSASSIYTHYTQTLTFDIN